MKKTNNTQPRAVKSRTVIPILKRPVDLILVSFFVINAFFITYVVDVEQLAVPGANPTPGNFEYPVWPPAPGVDLVHWWGRNFDPVLMARPVWWKMTIVCATLVLIINHFHSGLMLFTLAHSTCLLFTHSLKVLLLFSTIHN